MMLISIVILGAFVYWIYNNRRVDSKFNLGKSPEDLLKERFVNGEIDEKTYMEMMEVLKG